MSEKSEKIIEAITFLEIVLSELKSAAEPDCLDYDIDLLKKLYASAYETGYNDAVKEMEENYSPRIDYQDGPFSIDCNLSDICNIEVSEYVAYASDVMNVEKMFSEIKKIFNINL